MEWSRDHCSVASTLEVIGERWTMLVLRETFFGVRRFDDFQRNIGLARNILADRLRTLVSHGILERRKYQDRPPRYEYRLTEKGIDLYPALIALLQWGDKYTAGRSGPPVILEHKGCGKHSKPHLVCSECNEPIGARDMRPLPGRATPKRKRAHSRF
ncbi:MAG: winged helix-turn-helix transcriptional regulator [Actinomycetota bacterium]